MSEDNQNYDAAVVLLLAEDSSKFLLLRRSFREGDPWSGHLSLPGGRIEPGDGGAVDTALRELHEECGIRVSGDGAICHPARMAGSAVLHPLRVIPVELSLDACRPTNPEAGEVDALQWVDVDLLRDKSLRESREMTPNHPGVHFPCIRLSLGTLWGFTLSLLSWRFGLGVSDNGKFWV